MRSHLSLFVAVAFAAITCSLSLPIAHGQTADEVINEVFNLFNNNSNSNNSNSSSNNNSNSSSGNRSGMFVNAFAEVDANTGYKSDPFPAGTRVRIQGPGTPSQIFKLPASVVVLADGSVGQLGASVSGNYLILDNRSPNNLDLEFILPGGTNTTPAPRPPANPNNRSSQGTGNVEAKNVSGVQVTVRYVLPSGKAYSYNGQSNTSLYAPLGHGRTDKTSDIAENTRVTVDGYVEEFYVVRNALLLISIHSNNVTAQTIPINSPSPSPNPPLNPNTPSTPSPLPPSNPTSNPAPSPRPNPGPLAGVPRNAIPTARTSPLTSAVALPLAQRINKEVKQLLVDFDQASMARVAALKNELITAGFPEDGAVAIGRAATDGDPMKITELFKEHRSNNANVPRSLESTHLAIATFRKSFTDLLAKIEAGSSSSSMGTEFRAIKEQATNLGAPGLSDAMTLAQQDLLIRDTINSSVISSVLSVGEQSLPTGRVMLIRHPWLDGPTIYLGTDGTILTRSSDANIVVAKLSAASALGLPTSDKLPVADAQSSSVPQEIIISNPATNRESVSYNLGGTPYTIAPNQTQRLPVGKTWQIEFSQGTGSSVKQYSLTNAGSFAFVLTNERWDLVAQEFSIRMNNPANSNTTLRYTANQQSFEVPAGSMVEHKSLVPLLVQFDQGNGSSTATKLIETKGDYLFSLNQDTKWELYLIPDGDEVASTTGTDNNQLTIMRPPVAALRQGAGSLLFDFSVVGAAPAGGNSLLDALKAAQ